MGGGAFRAMKLATRKSSRGERVALGFRASLFMESIVALLGMLKMSFKFRGTAFIERPYDLIGSFPVSIANCS